MFDPDQFHDPEFRTLVLAARAVIAERVHRGVATPRERLAVAALDEMPTRTTPPRCGRGRRRPRSGMRFAQWCSRRWSSTSASSRRWRTKPTERTATTARRCTDHGRRLPARGRGQSLPLPPPQSARDFVVVSGSLHRRLDHRRRGGRARGGPGRPRRRGRWQGGEGRRPGPRLAPAAIAAGPPVAGEYSGETGCDSSRLRGEGSRAITSLFYERPRKHGCFLALAG